ncbi:MAG: glycosyltransferase [Firmicutes bacterium]|nr:glycosyltransferase [Bacillota bacterium]
MNIKVSVIVPVYNSEKYLQECLKYLLNQTLEEIEIICINDASTDNSVEILGSAVAQYPNKIKAVTLKENSGPGTARNLGISIAKGEYIGFVDSDDLVKPNMFEIMYKKAIEDKADVVDCGYYNEQMRRNAFTVSDDETGLFESEKRCRLAAKSGYIFSKIIKRTLIVKNEIYFRGKVIYEDIDFLFLVYMYAKNISNVKAILYFYRHNIASSSKKLNLNKVYKDLLGLITAVNERGKTSKRYKDMRIAVEYITVYYYILIIENFMLIGFREIKNVRKYLEEIASVIDKYKVSINYEKNELIKKEISEEQMKLYFISMSIEELIKLNRKFFDGEEENFVQKYRDEYAKKVLPNN